MDHITAEILARQREDRLRRAALDAPHDTAPEPLRRRTARRLHRIARAIDVTDL